MDGLYYLIKDTNYGEGGGLQNWSGGACEVLPLRKRGVGAEKVEAILKGA